MNQNIQFIIHGRVQGVGFRYHTHTAALHLGVRGYVCNQNDGSVKVIASGDSAQIAALRDALWQGSPWARVQDVEETPLPAQDFPDFRIRY